MLWFVTGAWSGAPDDAAPPKWMTSLSRLREALLDQVDTAEQRGAFVFATTFNQGKNRMYIRPEALFRELADKLRPVDPTVPSGQQDSRGVLVWGSKGMGKSSLAKHIAFEFSFDPGKPYC